jgi:hypothetical protein
MKSIFPSAIDGDLLKLVHSSNGFCMMQGASPLQAHHVCQAEARIVSVTNVSEEKIVKVKGNVYCGGQTVVEVVSSFTVVAFWIMRTPLRSWRSLAISSLWTPMLMSGSFN